MKRYLLLVLFAITGVFGLHASDAVVQYSSYTALLQRLFDGFVTYEEALEYGDTGVGTTDGLNGEVIIQDGVPYRVNFDGKVDQVALSESSPYITLCDTPADEAVEIALPKGISYPLLTETIVDLLGERFQKNYPYAILISGHFTHVKTRSVPKSEKPYPALIDIVKEQHTFDFENRAFTLIGFWYPGYAKAFNPPQWHIHGLTQDKTAGGHVLEFETADDVTIQLWKKTTFVVHQPDTTAFAETDFDVDLSAAVKKVNHD